MTCDERFSTVERAIYRSSAKTRKRQYRIDNLKNALETALQAIVEFEGDDDG